MTAVLTREQAAAAVAAAVSERDTIQANLLDLDGSFGKRLLAGAKPAGQTKRRWDAATAGLTTLFHRFSRHTFGWDAQHERVLTALVEMGIDAVYSDHVDRMMPIVGGAAG